MRFKDLPIRRKLMAMLLFTSGAVLVLTCVAFVSYEFVSFRAATLRNLSTLGRVIASNSTAPLAFDNQADATEVLTALKAEPHVVAAALYDAKGSLFARYPVGAPTVSGAAALPATPGPDGYRFTSSGLVGVEPVREGTNRRLGTLYVRSDLLALREQLTLYSVIALVMTGVAFFVAYLLSRLAQQQISRPVQVLAETARAVSQQRDYSVRAMKLGEDELGSLTDAFNRMLAQIQEQDRTVRESEARLRAVLNSALTAVIVIDARGQIIDWNPRAQLMFGWTREEAIGRDLADTVIPPSFREAHREGLRQCLRTGQGDVLNRVMELTALRRDRSEFPVEVFISDLHGGAETTFCGFITDITERKEAEGRLRAQLVRLNLLGEITRAISERQDVQSIFQVVIRAVEEHFLVGFCAICLYDEADNSLTVTSVGARSASLAGELAIPERARVEIDENGLSRCVHGQLVYEPDVREVRVPFLARLARGGLSALVAAPLLAESRVFGVLMAARSAPHSFSSGECEFLRQLSEHVGLAVQQAQLYQALQRAYDDLKQTQQAVMQQERLLALGKMASGIAHDINNAITPIALYADSMLEREVSLSPMARGHLEIIRRAIDDVAHTVARMREFYRSREPQQALAPVDLNRLVLQVVDLTRARWSDMAQQRGAAIELRTELALEGPVIAGVEGELRDALTNLIFNAVDAMPAGGELRLRTRVLRWAAAGSAAEREKVVQLEVIDNGVGMDEETRQRCLEPFFTTKGERGTGLGLAMVYGTAERHGADLEVQSAVGQGTTVQLSFAVPTEPFGPDTAVAPIQVVASRRILVVDDDPLILHSLRATLEADGHVVTAADGGQAGINAFVAAEATDTPFEVVMTDLGMPHVDGRTLAAAVKSVRRDAPVLLLTGWGRRILAEGDVPPHVDRVLSKPPKLRELREALAALAATRASR
jgi:PAS domain S-box-containing protein